MIHVAVCCQRRPAWIHRSIPEYRFQIQAFKLLKLLQDRGAILSYNDPHIPVLPSMRHYRVPRLASEDLTVDYLASEDCILIATDHSAYDWDFIGRHARLIVDTRSAMSRVPKANARVVIA